MHEYPSHLVKELRSTWPRKVPFGLEQFPSLPPNDVLIKLFDESFNASLRTEEHRRLRFRWIFCPYKQLATYQNPSAERLYEPILFEKPVPFSADQITRLAPAIDLTTSLIGVEESEQGLRIWGLIHAGSSWWKFVRGMWTTADVLPMHPLPFLILSSMRPGELSISCNGYVILTLADGKVRRPTMDLLAEASSPLSNFFDKARRGLVEELYDRARALGVSLFSDIPARNSYGLFLRNLLAKVQDQDHGGSLIFVKDELSAENTPLKELLNIKYASQFSRVWELMANLFLIYSRLSKLRDSVTDSSVTARREAISQIEKLCRSRQLIVSELDDAAHFIASLTAVDGAVVITDRFRVLGFGAEVKIPTSRLVQVSLIEGKEHYPLRIDSFGTRHRSAFRFCDALNNSVVFIVSQDGEVKGTTCVQGEVILWNNIINLSDYGVGFPYPRPAA